jgi:hypothetical protein
MNRFKSALSMEPMGFWYQAVSYLLPAAWGKLV